MTRPDDKDKPAPVDNVMGVRKGKGPDQYGGSYAGGQSGGGAYANPHTGRAPAEDVNNGQVGKGYYGGGQAAGRNDGDSDHHAASRHEPVDDDAGVADHASQQTGRRRQDFDEAIERAGRRDQSQD